MSSDSDLKKKTFDGVPPQISILAGIRDQFLSVWLEVSHLTEVNTVVVRVLNQISLHRPPDISHLGWDVSPGHWTCGQENCEPVSAEAGHAREKEEEEADQEEAAQAHHQDIRLETRAAAQTRET